MSDIIASLSRRTQAIHIKCATGEHTPLLPANRMSLILKVDRRTRPKAKRYWRNLSEAGAHSSKPDDGQKKSFLTDPVLDAGDEDGAT